mgnify:CR=1 FL=1
MKKVIILIFFTAMVMFTVSIEEYMEMALERSNAYRIAESEYRMKEVSYRIAKGAFLPEVLFKFRAPDYSWREDLINYFGLPQRISFISETNNTGASLGLSQWLPFSGRLNITGSFSKYRSEYNLYDDIDEFDLNTSLSLTVPILEEDLQVVEARRKKCDLLIAKNKFDKEKKTIEKNAASFYIMAQLYAVREMIAREELSNTERLYEMTRDKLKTGISSELDLLDIEIRLSEKKIGLLEAENQKGMAFKKLKDFVNSGAEIAVDEGQAELFDGKPDFDYEDILSRALRTDENLDSLELQIGLIKRELRYDVFRKYFSASVSAGYTLDGKGETADEALGDFRKNYWFVFLNLSVPIFTGSIKSSEIKYKELSLQKIELDKDEYEKNLIEQIRTSYDRYTLLKKNLDLARMQADKAKKLFELTELRYAKGLESLDRMKEVEVAYENARYSLGNTIKELNISYLELIYYSEE